MNSQIKNRSVLGVNLFAQAILVIPKTLVMNAGHDPQEAILSCMSSDNSDGSGDFYVGEPLQARGVDLNTGKWIESGWAGIYDIYAAKRQMIDARWIPNPFFYTLFWYIYNVWLMF